MPIYLFWGDDDFVMQRAITELRDRVLDPAWTSFNLDKIAPEDGESLPYALTQALTPPFGAGSRLVWLADTAVFQRCPDDWLQELERTLPVLPETTVLLFTTATKPDGRLKSTKLLQRHAEIREFSLIPPWKTDQLLQHGRQAAQTVGVKLTPAALQLLVEAVGNQSRHLYTELEKLHLYAGSDRSPLSDAIVSQLITVSTQTSLQLAAAIRQGQTSHALGLVSDLLQRNEPALRIVATLVGQFRTWLWVKLMLETGERNDRAIAEAAEVSNPKRIYFLQQEVRSAPLASFQQTLPLLLELEFGLKQGKEPIALLQTQVIRLCQLFQTAG